MFYAFCPAPALSLSARPTIQTNSGLVAETSFMVIAKPASCIHCLSVLLNGTRDVCRIFLFVCLRDARTRRDDRSGIIDKPDHQKTLMSKCRKTFLEKSAAPLHHRGDGAYQEAERHQPAGRQRVDSGAQPTVIVPRSPVAIAATRTLSGSGSMP